MYPSTVAVGRRLAWYASHFDTVEVNTTFYRRPDPERIDRWRAQTPPGFCFAVKGSRYLTHMKKLTDTGRGLERFFERAAHFGNQVGPVLFQLPPRWGCDVGRLRAFLQALPSGYRYVVECRDRSWHTESVYEALREANAAFCAYDLSGVQSPVVVTADFAYVRLHGPAAAYRGRYRISALQPWARRIRRWRTRLKGVFVYFDNDEAGYAARNARKLLGLVVAPGVVRLIAPNRTAA